MVKGLSLGGTFLFYAAMNVIGGIALYYMLPETEGRTLQEIEEHYAGIHNLKDRPKQDDLPCKEKWAANNPGLINDEVESKV